MGETYLKGTYMTTTNELKENTYKHSNKLTSEAIAWIERHKALAEAGYTQYQFNLTYFPNLKSAKGHTSEEVQKKFTDLYLYKFCRYYLFDGDKNWTSNSHELQPYLDVFEEAHEHGAIFRPHLNEGAWKQYQFSDRLHHHGIISVHPMHVEKMNDLVGKKNPLNPYSNHVMTSHVGLVYDSGWTTYILKDQDKFIGTSLHYGPKNLEFPPKLYPQMH